ncbi:exodeoxyribonuclease VII large subunit [Aerococcaceae bacterium DSM 111021]|nr:exodeoxyribonuclease VII large subunit [Aerococcaceae bacterium DSM 111021]
MSESKQEYLTVQALTKYIKRKFDVDPHLQRVFVVGEVSNFRLRPNSHQYFSLKDEGARISAVMYRSAFQRVKFNIEEGMKVFVTGKITLYEPTGAYQIVIDSIQPDGIGALYQQLEQLKQKFKEAGHFDQPKLPIPRFPKKIAVITSPTGAVIRDIITTINRRYPIVEITVVPTRVQGKEAASEIVEAFNKVSQRQDEFDTVIVARGGGSIEDLWCFNDEQVAMAILNCPLPVISSIGHETDTTMADLVADVRAATPTAAAEIAAPVLQEVLAYLTQMQERVFYSMNQRIQYMRKYYDRFAQSYVMTQPERLYQPYMQQLDLAVEKLTNNKDNYFTEHKNNIKVLKQRLAVQQPQGLINQYQKDLSISTNQLFRNMNQYQHNKSVEFGNMMQLLDAYSPLKSVQRGYAVVTSDEDIVKHITQVEKDDMIKVNLSDGLIEAQVTRTTKENIFKQFSDLEKE